MLSQHLLKRLVFDRMLSQHLLSWQLFMLSKAVFSASAFASDCSCLLSKAVFSPFIDSSRFCMSDI